MAVLYIKEQGAHIQKNGEVLRVTKNGKKLLDVPMIHVEKPTIVTGQI